MSYKKTWCSILHMICWMTFEVTSSCNVALQHPLLVKKLSVNNIHFAFDVYQGIKTNSGGNVLVSNLGATTAVGIISLGAKGKTGLHLKELFKTLKVDGEIGIGQALADVHRSLTCSLNEPSTSAVFTTPATSSSPDTTNGPLTAINKGAFYSVNAIFVTNAPFVTVRNSYVVATSNYYNVTVNKLDPSGNLNDTSTKINNFISERTNKTVNNGVDLENVTEAQLLLVNAVYLKFRWDEMFEKRYTRLWQFQVTPGKNVWVKMMGKQGVLAYTNRLDLRCRMLQLNYAEQRLAMFVVLPYEVADLALVERLMTSENFGSMEASLRPTNVVVRLPKFTLQANNLLSDTLNTMGYGDVFDRELADLRGIFFRGSKIPVAEIFQTSVIEVDEEGQPPQSNTLSFNSAVEFTVDHPFIFIIRDQISGIILFVGRLVNPQQKNP